MRKLKKAIADFSKAIEVDSKTAEAWKRRGQAWAAIGETAEALVVGVTIRLDMLDPALLRKGMFDKTISIGLPSQEGRLAILHVHSHNKGFKSEKEKQKLLTELPSITFDHSGTGLQNVLQTRPQFWQQGRINILVRELICWRLSEG